MQRRSEWGAVLGKVATGRENSEGLSLDRGQVVPSQGWSTGSGQVNSIQERSMQDAERPFGGWNAPSLLSATSICPLLILWALAPLLYALPVHPLLPQSD